MAWTKQQDDLIRERYRTEGASKSLVADTGLPAWKIRHRANSLGIKMDASAVRRKRMAYNGSKFGW